MLNESSIVYCRTTKPASESADGETPSQIIVTKEVNGYAVWSFGEEGTRLIGFSVEGTTQREDAIETAVSLSRLRQRK